MPTYRKQALHDNGQIAPAPDPQPVSGLQVMRRAPAVEVLRGQDKVATLGRRIVCSGGQRGDTKFRVPDTDPLSATQTHPDATTWYVISRALVEITPGSFLELSGAYVPSGETNRPATAAEIAAGSLAYRAAGPQGRVRVTVVWTDRAASTETTQHEVSLPGSTLEFGAQNTSAGGLWSSLRTFRLGAIRPPDLLNLVELRRFCQHVSAEITVEVQGSPRLIDWSIWERPYSYCYDTTSVPTTYATQHVAATGTPDDQLAPAYPFTDTTSTNPTGTGRILDVARAQAERLGPMLFAWTVYNETTATATATITERTTANDGSVFEDIVFAAITSFSPTSEAGWSVSCGGYAQRWTEGSPLVLFDRIAVVPVLVRVHGRTITAGTGTVRVQTAVHSYVDVSVPVAGASAWVEAYGWLEVGINPDQPVRAQVRINHLGASGSLSLGAVEVYWHGASTAAVV